MEAKCIRAWIETPRTGSGWREYLIVKVGRKHVSLLALGDITAVKIGKTQFEELMSSDRTTVQSYSNARLRRRIKANMDAYGVDTNLCADALALVTRKREIAR